MVVRGNLFEKLRIERNSQRASVGGRESGRERKREREREREGEKGRERFVEMQQGVRAVEAYRRTLLVDGVTNDTDSIAPVYKLEELCTLIRTSSLDIVRELLDRILKRLDHRSPVVKQKVGLASLILWLLFCFLFFGEVDVSYLDTYCLLCIHFSADMKHAISATSFSKFKSCL